eukprot:6456843-Amphidinium_carterae.2
MDSTPACVCQLASCGHHRRQKSCLRRSMAPRCTQPTLGLTVMVPITDSKKKLINVALAVLIHFPLFAQMPRAQLRDCTPVASTIGMQMLLGMLLER